MLFITLTLVAEEVPVFAASSGGYTTRYATFGTTATAGFQGYIRDDAEYVQNADGTIARADAEPPAPEPEPAPTPEPDTVLINTSLLSSMRKLSDGTTNVHVNGDVWHVRENRKEILEIIRAALVQSREPVIEAPAPTAAA